MKVGAFIVGAQKCGTTALFDYLAQHPLVTVPTRKELHWFDDDEVGWEITQHRRLHDSFLRRNDWQLALDATPTYLWHPEAPARIATYNPNARLIVMVRDPVERAYSHWLMERSRGNEPQSFQAAVERETRADGSGRDPVRSYVARGFYGYQLRRLLRWFPPGQLAVVWQDALWRDHGRVLGLLCRFLGLPPFPRAPRPVVRRTRASLAGVHVMHPTSQAAHALAARYTHDTRFLARLLETPGLTVIRRELNPVPALAVERKVPPTEEVKEPLPPDDPKRTVVVEPPPTATWSLQKPYDPDDLRRPSFPWRPVMIRGERVKAIRRDGVWHVGTSSPAVRVVLEGMGFRVAEEE